MDRSPYLEFIETQDVCVVRKIARDRGDRISSRWSQLCLHGVHALVDVDHEGVEVYAPLARDVRGQRFVEEVHEHRLAGADVAVEVQSFRDLVERHGPGFWGIVAGEKPCYL